MYLFVISCSVEQELWVMTTKRLDNRVYAAVIFHIFRGRVPVVCLLSCFLVKFTNAYDNSSCSTSRWLTAGEGSRNSDWRDEKLLTRGLEVELSTNQTEKFELRRIRMRRRFLWPLSTSSTNLELKVSLQKMRLHEPAVQLDSPRQLNFWVFFRRFFWKFSRFFSIILAPGISGVSAVSVIQISGSATFSRRSSR